MPHRLRATCVAVLLAGVSFAAAVPMTGVSSFVVFMSSSAIGGR